MNPPKSSILSLRDVLHLLFKRKFQILLFFSATVITVTIGALLDKPSYKAVSQILVKAGRENLYVPTVPSTRNNNPVIKYNRDDQINSEIQIIKSRSLAKMVVEALGPTNIYKDIQEISQDGQSPVEIAIIRLLFNLNAEGIEESNVIKISFTHEDPHMAAAVLNKLSNLYLDRHLQVYKTPQSFKFFREQSQILKNKLLKEEEKLRVFKQQHNISSLEEERQLLLSQLANQRAALNSVLSQEAETNDKILYLRQQLSAMPRTVKRDEEIDHNPVLFETLKSRMVELKLKEKELLTKYTDQSRLVQNVREEISIVQQTLNELNTKRSGKSHIGLNETYRVLQETLIQYETDLKALKAKKEILKTPLVDNQKRLTILNQSEVELNRIKSEVDTDRRNYDLYLTKFEESRISDAMDTEKITNVSLLEPASPPINPENPAIAMKIALGIFLGVVGGLGIALTMEFLGDRLEKPEDAEECLKLPVLVSIPLLKK
jgi:uncharacterized protein involved in exopolysaccharide biosynthesis